MVLMFAYLVYVYVWSIGIAAIVSTCGISCKQYVYIHMYIHVYTYSIQTNTWPPHHLLWFVELHVPAILEACIRPKFNHHITTTSYRCVDVVNHVVSVLLFIS